MYMYIYIYKTRGIHVHEVNGQITSEHAHKQEQKAAHQLRSLAQ